MGGSRNRSRFRSRSEESQVRSGAFSWRSTPGTVVRARREREREPKRERRTRVPPRRDHFTRGAVVPGSAYRYMQTPSTLIIQPVAHPDPRVHRAGFALDDPYLERCWLPILGPTSVLLLRRMPVLWKNDPAIGVPVDELAFVLGLGHGTGRHSPVWRTVDRLARFNFAYRVKDNQVDVYTEVPPLNARHLASLPPSVRDAHDQLLTAHVERLGVAATVSSPAPTPATPAPRVGRTIDARHPSVATLGTSSGLSL